MNSTIWQRQLKVTLPVLALSFAACISDGARQPESEELIGHVLPGIRLGMTLEETKSIREVEYESSGKRYIEQLRGNPFFDLVAYRFKGDSLQGVTLSRTFSMNSLPEYTSRIPELRADLVDLWGEPDRTGTYSRNYGQTKEYHFVVHEWNEPTFVGKLTMVPPETADLAREAGNNAVVLSFLVWIDRNPAEERVGHIDWIRNDSTS